MTGQTCILIDGPASSDRLRALAGVLPRGARVLVVLPPDVDDTNTERAGGDQAAATAPAIRGSRGRRGNGDTSTSCSPCAAQPCGISRRARRDAIAWCGAAFHGSLCGNGPWQVIRTAISR